MPYFGGPFLFFSRSASSAQVSTAKSFVHRRSALSQLSRIWLTTASAQSATDLLPVGLVDGPTVPQLRGEGVCKGKLQKVARDSVGRSHRGHD